MSRRIDDSKPPSYNYDSTVQKMNYQELTDELQNRPPRDRSAAYIRALREERDKRDTEMRLWPTPTASQRQLLDAISDCESRMTRLDSVAAARALALDEAEADLSRERAHKKRLEGELAASREGAAEAFRDTRRGMPSNEEVRAAAHLGVRGDE